MLVAFSFLAPVPEVRDSVMRVLWADKEWTGALLNELSKFTKGVSK